MISRLYLMPTQKCNCQCTYCYIPESEKVKSGESDFLLKLTNEFVSNLKTGKHTDTPEIRFIGGEPYMSFDTVYKITDKFLSDVEDGKIIINTNGTLINKQRLSRLKELGGNRVIHIISLDGLKDVHDSRRKLKNGESSFNAAVEGIKLLQASGMPVYINMVIDKSTMTRAKKFFEFVKTELAMNKMSVSLLQSTEKPISKHKKLELLEQAYQLGEEYNIRIGGHHRLLLGKEICGLKCKAGQKTMLISADKKVYACQRFVGKTEAPAFDYDFNTYNFLDFDCVEKDCYTEENKYIGTELLKLYKRKYPEYLLTNEFDKLLFGVI